LGKAQLGKPPIANQVQISWKEERKKRYEALLHRSSLVKIVEKRKRLVERKAADSSFKASRIAPRKLSQEKKQNVTALKRKGDKEEAKTQGSRRFPHHIGRGKEGRREKICWGEKMMFLERSAKIPQGRRTRKTKCRGRNNMPVKGG